MTATTVRLWFVATGPPLAWAAHLLVAYSAEEAICSRSLRPEILGVPLYEVGVAVATVALAAVAAWAGTKGYRTWRTAKSARAAPPRGREAIIGALGAVFAPLFVAAILLGAASIVFLGPCAQR